MGLVRGSRFAAARVRLERVEAAHRPVEATCGQVLSMGWQAGAASGIPSAEATCGQELSMGWQAGTARGIPSWEAFTGGLVVGPGHTGISCRVAMQRTDAQWCGV